jgi:putative transposase
VPLGLAHVEGVTPGYIRHGTTALFAALDVATKAVLGQCQRRHRHQELRASWSVSTRACPPSCATHGYAFSWAVRTLAMSRWK